MNEIKKSIVKNQIEKVLTSSKERFKPKSFIEKYLAVYFFSEKVKYFFQLISFLAAFMYVKNLVEYYVVNSFLVGAILACLFLLIIEYIKHKITSIAFDQAIQEERVNTSLIVVLALMVLSAFLSVNGVKEYAESKIVEPEYIVLERGYYNNQIDSLEDLKSNILSSNDYKSVMWVTGEGNVKTISREGKKMIAGYQNEINILNTAYDRANKKMLAKFEAEKVKIKQANKNNIITIAFIAFFNEGLYVLCVLFASYYAFKAYNHDIEDQIKIQPEVEELTKESDYVSPAPLLKTGFQLKNPNNPNKTDYRKKYPQVITDIEKGLSVNQLMKKHDLSRATIHNIKRQIK